MADSTAVGALSVVIGGLASVVVAFVSRSRTPAAPSAPVDTPQELTTISGLAAAVVQQGEQLAEVRAEQVVTRRTVDALRRYVVKLLRSWPEGVPAPEPDRADQELIQG